MAGKTLQLFLKGIEWKTTILRIEKDATIAEFRKKVSDLIHIRDRAFRVLYCGKDLTAKDEYGNTQYLRDYTIKDEAILFVVLLVDDWQEALDVYIWSPDAKHVGHAAVELIDGTYISWWPATSCNVKTPRARAAPMPELSSDIASEGNRNPNAYGISASYQELNAIKRWWAGYKDKADYQFISNNCSTVAYYALEAAFPFLKDLNDEVAVWVPEATEMLAQDLAAGKRSISKKRTKEIKAAAARESMRIAVEGGVKSVFGVAGKR